MSASKRPLADADEEPVQEGKKSKAKASSRTDFKFHILRARWPGSTKEDVAKKALVQAINRVMDRGHAGPCSTRFTASSRWTRSWMERAERTSLLLRYSSTLTTVDVHPSPWSAPWSG